MSSPMSIMGQIPTQLKPYYQPYMDAGTQAIPTLEDQYTKLLTNPGGMFNQMGESFQQSPGFNFAMQQALQGAGHAEAAGGMAGSPEHEQENMTLATNLGDQDYYNYMNHVIGLYGQGLSGEQDLMHQGLNATEGYTGQMAQAIAGQAMLKYQQQAGKNASKNAAIGGISMISPAAGAALSFL